jgi:hypothetical protein
MIDDSLVELDSSLLGLWLLDSKSYQFMIYLGHLPDVEGMTWKWIFALGDWMSVARARW